MTSAGRPAVSVGDLAVPRQPIPDATRCDELNAMFVADRAMSSAIVVTGSVPRLVNRAAFFQVMTGRRGYGWALYHRKAVHALPESAWSAIAFGADVAVIEAGLAVLEARVATTDDILALWDDGRAGSVGVSKLFAAVSEHHRAQAEVVAGSERRFRSLIEHLSDAIVVVDPAGNVTYSGQTGMGSPGLDPAAMAGGNLGDVIYADDRGHFEALLEETLYSPGVPLTVELRMDVAATLRVCEMVARNLILDPTVGGIVINYRDVTHQRELENRLRHQALHDPLTGLPNRALLVDRMRRAVERVRRTRRPIALLYLDLDRFKTINDTLGHTAGDRLLEAVGRALDGSVRPGDTLARLGGDEFAVLLDDVSDAGHALEVAARLQSSLSGPMPIGQVAVNVEASIGVAVLDDSEVGADELLRRADMAMYAAKALGKNRIVPWSSDLQVERERAGLIRAGAESA
jgi:diguanylate cyclase (GGDEF)-like protein/PAS domain S-box-containing protein